MNNTLNKQNKENLYSQKLELVRATENDIEWIAELEQDVYSIADAVPLSALIEWYKTNPNGFFIIKKDGLRIGHIDLLPFRVEKLNLFINGGITEQEIHSDFLINHLQKESINHIYIESLAIPHLKGLSKAYALKFSLNLFGSLVQNLCTPNHSTIIYAMPASTEGLNMLTKLNFKKLVDGKKRIDGHSMYKIHYFDLLESIKKYTIDA